MNIVCHIDKKDTFEIKEQATSIVFFDSNSFSYTFWDNRINYLIGTANNL